MRSKLGEDDDEPLLLLLFVPSCPSSSVITFAGADIVEASRLVVDGRHGQKIFLTIIILKLRKLLSSLSFFSFPRCRYKLQVASCNAKPYTLLCIDGAWQQY